jgi:hypothetical protein
LAELDVVPAGASAAGAAPGGAWATVAAGTRHASINSSARIRSTCVEERGDRVVSTNQPAQRRTRVAKDRALFSVSQTEHHIEGCNGISQEDLLDVSTMARASVTPIDDALTRPSTQGSVRAAQHARYRRHALTFVVIRCSNIGIGVDMHVTHRCSKVAPLR